ncbi:hypothetical protein [Sphingomonas crusticola]|uniref:hypothetical protein n=1 Tax=Sphingomonas crusticola TaxID=1697973 RepID=UPI000E281AFD|nr:hypothetical protein [Sphingomonas crusticola]
MLGKIAFTLLLLLWPAAVSAKVTLTFYSRELGVYFPHAFVRITGATDAEPQKLLDDNYGFTAKVVTPALLVGAVPGKMMAAPKPYVARSDSHLSLTLTDEQYSAVLATVQKWRDLPQPSYDLKTRNCVFFVGDVARTLGMRVDDGEPRLMTRPRSYIINLIRLNPGVGTLTPGGRAERALATPADSPKP